MRTIVAAGLIGGMLMLAGCAASGVPITVKLTAAERAGFERVDEPVTFGVPLPAGAVYDPQTLCLLDEQGRAIPASFREAQKWVAQPGRPGVGSLRWVHVNSLLSVPARGTRTLTLTNSSRERQLAVAPGDLKDSPLKVTADAKAAKATIITGPVKLELNAHLAGVIESAVFGDKQLIDGSSGSGVTAGGKTFTEIDPATAKVEVLEAGPMRAVVLLTGKFKGSEAAGAVGEIPGTDETEKAVSATEAEAGKAKGPGLVYEARVYAYAGSPRIAIDYTFINKLGVVAANKIDLEDLSVRWPLAAALPERAVQRHDVSVDLAGQYRLRRNDTQQAGDARTEKPAAMGWLTVGGVAVGVRDFWQMFPKKLAVVGATGGAAIEVGLYPKEAGKSLELFIGQARTHRITLLFHDGQAKPEALNAVFAAANVPLVPLAEPAWYCQKTQAWGPIVSADADYGPFADVEKRYNENLSESMDNIIRNVEVGLTDGGVTQDGYGWLNWGDSLYRVPRPGWGPTFADPVKNLSWNGNYYDYGMAMVYQWARTADLRFLDNGLRAAAYTADVFINHWYPDPARIGACHYCPPRYHAAIDDGTPYVSEQFNHAKNHSIVMRWQMLGDWWARQVMLETFNHAASMESPEVTEWRRQVAAGGDINATMPRSGTDIAAWRQCRGNGHRLHMIWVAYEFTGEKRFVDRADWLLKLGADFIKRNTEFDKRPQQRFMVGVALEAMIEQYWIRPDPAVLDTIKFVADYAAKEQDLKGYTGNMAFAYGFLWKQTGDVNYLRTLRRLLRATGTTNHAKYFGQTFRSTPYALGYLAEAAAKGVDLPILPSATSPDTTNSMMMIKGN